MIKKWLALFDVLNHRNVTYAVFKHIEKIDRVLDFGGELDIFCDDYSKVHEILKEEGWIEYYRPLTDLKGLHHWYILVDNGVLHLHVYAEFRSGHSFAKEALLQRLDDKDLTIYRGLYICKENVVDRIKKTRKQLKTKTILGKLIFRLDGKYLREFNTFDNSEQSWPSFYLTRFWRLKIYVNFVRYMLYRLCRSKKSMSRGLIVSITGSDGTGKSTLISSLEYDLQNFSRIKVCHIGKPVTLSSNSRNRAPLTKLIRKQVLIMLRFIEIFKALLYRQMGYLVLMDRYVAISKMGMDSMYVSFKQNKMFESIEHAINSIWRYLLPRPNIVIRLTAPLRVLIERDSKRESVEGKTEIENRYELFSSTVYPGKIQISIDTELLSKSEVKMRVFNEISKIL